MDIKPKTYRPEAGQIGSQLDSTFFLFDDCIRNMDDVDVKEYERMIDTDETIAVGIQFLTMSVLLKLGEYDHPTDKNISKFVNDNFESMQGNLYTAGEDILSALWAGFSGTEICWKPSGSQIMLDKLTTYHPRTVLIRVNQETGDYEGIKQWRWFAGSPVDIPKEKVILFNIGKKFGNHYGRSMCKPIRKNWLLKDPVLKMWARALDRFGTPLLGAIVPDEMIKDPENSEQDISQMAYALRLLANIQNGTGIVLKSALKGEVSTDVKALTSGGAGVGEAFMAAANYYNKMMLRGLLVPSLVFDEGQKSGSYALGQSHFAIYNMMTSGIYRGFKEAIIEQVVRPMIVYNFGEQKDLGDFAERKIAEEDKKLLFEGFTQLTNTGYLDSQVQEDFDYVREAAGAPARDIKKPADDMINKAKAEVNRYTRAQDDIGDPLEGE